MNPAPHTVAALFPHACVLVDYDTGTTKLRTVPKQPTDLAATVVRLDEAAASWGTVEVPAVLPAYRRVPLQWRLGAVLAVLVTAAVRVGGRWRFRRLVRLACCGRSLRPVTGHQARYAVRAVRWASWPMPTRWACLEESTAAAVLLAAAGRRAEWRHGVAIDPVRLHAWLVDQHGAPVEERPDTALYGATYTPDGPGPAREGQGETTP
ncbi:lasso peptide biosynthesis B2 protein [Streptomyces sp. TS71-3]|uniref:lasso peptide biosynthesis B2 protein n=1 Tax=Streptomyces sp. TS71-3 TaxID=2733862 RepID=UPI001AFF895C|nr:lasso peptide biosynthesis B2 protein [Streptomyces sp. TS71-3]GHJ34467.1 hypothetical protein Sm713_00760 [Streptomyces sp. TS71-3]